MLAIVSRTAVTSNIYNNSWQRQECIGWVVIDYFLSSLLKYGWILRIVDYFWNVSLNWRDTTFIFIAHMSIVSILSIMITTTKNEDESLLFLSWRITTMQRPQKYVEIRFLIKNGNYCYVSMICCSQSFHMYWLKYDYHNSYCKFVNSICI